MSLRRRLQDHPFLLVQSWRLTAIVLATLQRPLARLGLERASRWLMPVERPLKSVLFDCRSCGQCVLHTTGMTCPMTCPKELRNGPCGGVTADGRCEVDRDRPCVWVEALERLPRTPWRQEVFRIHPAVDWRLEHLSSWATFALGRDRPADGEDRPEHVSGRRADDR